VIMLRFERRRSAADASSATVLRPKKEENRRFVLQALVRDGEADKVSERIQDG
jgi:hypothetical protein